ncbi:MAG: hypothetical protein HOL66_03095 [Rhodospirillaceae bacterium]|jgi:hypothetical protein|nr:hypothetical protein [Rhodospirillaceae bacterium]MBT5243213.1 hypothetical protein [Rhodospirillaceae bacterium]MBT6243751.1 hypothetical protein [Rhodospirillaceae bacterium]
MKNQTPFRYFNTSPEIIRLAVMALNLFVAFLVFAPNGITGGRFEKFR